MEAVLEQGLEQVEQSSGGDGGQLQQPDPKQADREYSQWLKTLKEDGDFGKHYRRIKDDFGRLESLKRLEPKGIDGVRERYAALDGVAYGDKKGIEAISTMQSTLAESQAALDAIAQGDLRSLSEDQRAGIMQSAPQLLDMLAESDAAGYVKAVLPHFVDALRGSQLYSAYGQLVDALSQEPPKWMKPEQKADWTNDRLQSVIAHASKMGQWFKAQDDRLKEIDTGRQKPNEEEVAQPKAETQTGTANPQFWKDNVYPDTNAIAEKTFNEELKPWAERLSKAGFRLSDAKKQALVGELVQGVISEANKNADYKVQMARYNRQRTPDKASIVSLFRSEFTKHAPNVMKALISRDYGQIIDKRTAPKPNGNGNGSKPAPIVPQKGVKIVTVKPSRADIDFPRTPAEWLYQNKWKMKDGSVQQYRP